MSLAEGAATGSRAGGSELLDSPPMVRYAEVALPLPLFRRDRIFGRAPQQRALYELIESLGGRAPVDHLLEQLSFSPSVLKGLVARGLVVIDEEVVSRDPFAARPSPAAPQHAPTAAQRVAIEAMTGGRPGETFLLHGITG